MAWSTSELARLTGTSTPTIRHYHRLGLLAEPERRGNGYKQYTVAHLVRVLQVRRLAERGVPLAQVATILREDEDSATALEQVDAELKASMRRLARARAELAAIRAHRARADTPSGFEDLAAGLSERQRSLLTVFSTVMGDGALAQFRDALVAGNDVDEDFENLSPEADDATIETLARRMAPTVAAAREERPQLSRPMTGSPLGDEQGAMVLAHAIAELYHPAQLRALQRVDEILKE